MPHPAMSKLTKKFTKIRFSHNVLSNLTNRQTDRQASRLRREPQTYCLRIRVTYNWQHCEPTDRQTDTGKNNITSF